jgi:hypothetical protein
LLLCLAFCLVCGEIPEISDLRDDTSNDSVGPVSSARIAEAIQIAHKVDIAGLGSSFADAAFRNLAMISSGEATAPSGSDLLRLLSVQRK